MILILLILLFMATSAVAATQAEIQAYLDSEWTANQSSFNSMANTGKADMDYYYLQQALLGWNSAHRAYGGTTYILRTLTYAETMMNKATLLDSCNRKNWIGVYTASVGGCSWTNAGTFLSETIGAMEMAHTVELIKTNTTLANTAHPNGGTYGSHADTVAAFLHEHMVQKWLIGRTQETWLASGDVAPVTDKAANMLVLLIAMDQAGYANTNIRSGLTYRQQIIAMLNRFLDRISAPTASIPCGSGTCSGGVAGVGAEIWRYKTITGSPECGESPNTVSPCSEDTSHGNRWPNAIARAVDAGFSSLVHSTPPGSTLAQFAVKVERVLSQLIWDKSTTTPRFTNYTDGANHYYRPYPAWENGYVAAGWGEIAHYHQDGMNAIMAMFNCVRADCGSPSRRFNAGSNISRTSMAGTTALAQARFTVPPVIPPIIVTAPSSVRAPITDRASVGSPAAVTDRPVVSRPTP